MTGGGGSGPFTGGVGGTGQTGGHAGVGANAGTPSTGSWIAAVVSYSDTSLELRALRLGEAEIQESVALSARGTVSVESWSPARDFLVFEEQAGDEAPRVVKIADFRGDGPVVRALGAETGPRVYWSVAWLGGDRLFAHGSYSAESDRPTQKALYIVDATAPERFVEFFSGPSRPRTSLSAVGDELLVTEASPDGSVVYFGEVRGVEVTRPLLALQSFQGQLGGARLSSDGRAFSGGSAIPSDPGSGFGVFNIVGSTAEPVTLPMNQGVVSSSWSPVGRRLVYVQDRPGEGNRDLFFIDAETRIGYRVNPDLEGGGLTDVVWLDEGRGVVYRVSEQRRAPDRLWLSDVSDPVGPGETFSIHPTGREFELVTQTWVGRNDHEFLFLGELDGVRHLYRVTVQGAPSEPEQLSGDHGTPGVRTGVLETERKAVLYRAFADGVASLHRVSSASGSRPEALAIPIDVTERFCFGPDQSVIVVPSAVSNASWATWYPRTDDRPVGEAVDLGAGLADGGRVERIYLDERGPCGEGS